MDLFSVMLGEKLGGGGAAPATGNNAKFIDEGSHQFLVVAGALEYLEIPEGITSLYYKAASNSIALAINLKTIVIPSTVTSLDASMFRQCFSLEKIIINKPENSIAGAPWNAPETCEIIWNG